MSKLDDFKNELAELMDRYNAEIRIDFSTGPDTHGLCELSDRLIVVLRDGFGIYKTLSYGHSFGAAELRED